MCGAGKLLALLFLPCRYTMDVYAAVCSPGTATRVERQRANLDLEAAEQGARFSRQAGKQMATTQTTLRWK